LKKVTKNPILIILLCLFTLTAISSQLSADTNTDPFFFIVIADPQIGFNYRKTTRDISEEVAHFNEAVEHINRLKPAFVVVCGDMVNNWDDEIQLHAFWQIESKLRPDVPVHFVCGNHDLKAANEKSIALYSKSFGRDHYRFPYNGSEFIVINSCLMYQTCAKQGLKEAPKNLPESAYLDDPAKELRNAQREWFEEQLAYAHQKGAAHIFVLTHHPWFVDEPDEPDVYENIPLAQRPDYLDLMDRYGVKYSISGHTHKEIINKSDKINIITSPALCKTKCGEGLRIFKVYPDRVEHTYYTLNKVPEKVEL